MTPNTRGGSVMNKTLAFALLGLACAAQPTGGGGDDDDDPPASGEFALQGKYGLDAILEVTGGGMDLQVPVKILLDLEQDGTEITATASLCDLGLPDIPVSGNLVTSELPAGLLASVDVIDAQI